MLKLQAILDLWAQGRIAVRICATKKIFYAAIPLAPKNGAAVL